MTQDTFGMKKNKYTNYDILDFKDKLLSPLHENMDFDIWFENLPDHTQKQIEFKFSRLTQKLSQGLAKKEVITKDKSQKISTYILNEIINIIGQTKEIDKDLKNEISISAKLILTEYNELVAISWFQEAIAKSYSFEYLIEQIKISFPNKTDKRLIELCNNTKFLEYLVNFGLFNSQFESSNSDKTEQERVLRKVTEICDNEKLIKQVFIKNKKESKNIQNKLLFEMVKLVGNNHPKKLALISILTLFESCTRAFSLNFLANSLSDKNIDNALVALGLIFITQISNSVIRISQGLVNNFMQYGTNQKDFEFNGLEAMLIKMINEDPFLAQKFDPVNLKSFLQKIEKEYHDLYNISFVNLIPNIFSVFGSILSATTLMKGSFATILPPITSIMLNYIAQEQRNRYIMPLKSKLIQIGAEADTLMQSLITEISNRLNIRDVDTAIQEIMPKILNINNKMLGVDESFFLFRQITVSTALYAGLSVLGIKMDNNILKALFGSDLDKTFGMAMLQTQTSYEASNLISGVKGLNLTQEIIFKAFINKLSKPSLKGFEIKNTNMEFKDFSLNAEHTDKKQTKLLNSGSIINVVGANGTGKSSLLNFINTKVSKKPFLGELTIGGIPTHLINQEQYHNTVISMPQNIQVFDGSIALNISGKNELNNEVLELFTDSPLAQNIGYKIFKGDWSNWSRSDQINWWKENISKVLIGSVFKIKNRNGEEIESKIDSLSGGEQKILGILRVLSKLLGSNMESNIVTLDEPLANLSYNGLVGNENSQNSIYTWMQTQILMILEKYPRTTVFFIDHSQAKDSLFNLIENSEKLKDKLQIFEM